MGHQFISSPADPCVIPLDQAWYCESCRAISNDETCCSCASAEHNQRLAVWLDRGETITIPPTGVFLTVIPAPKKHPEKVECISLHRAPRAS